MERSNLLDMGHGVIHSCCDITQSKLKKVFVEHEPFCSEEDYIIPSISYFCNWKKNVGAAH